MSALPNLWEIVAAINSRTGTNGTGQDKQPLCEGKAAIRDPAYSKADLTNSGLFNIIINYDSY